MGIDQMKRIQAMYDGLVSRGKLSHKEAISKVASVFNVPALFVLEVSDMLLGG